MAKAPIYRRPLTNVAFLQTSPKVAYSIYLKYSPRELLKSPSIAQVHCPSPNSHVHRQTPHSCNQNGQIILLNFGDPSSTLAMVMAIGKVVSLLPLCHLGLPCPKLSSTHWKCSSWCVRRSSKVLSCTSKVGMASSIMLAWVVPAVLVSSSPLEKMHPRIQIFKPTAPPP